MEEPELEEGEARCYQNGDGSTIDPDASLSYIDEKLQDVLGHFQNDFEGGVSAENLGAKFGGYGSFLPPSPSTPPKVHYYNTPKSPSNLHLKGSVMVEKRTFKLNGTSKDRLNGEKIDQPSTSRVYPRAVSNVTPLAGKRPISDAAATVTLVVQEDWLCHDKCVNSQLPPLVTTPDVFLSYIDEKVQNVLGRFQKDFEGEVSAEKLGSKFGGYGSFLPVYQRSTQWFDSRTPRTVHNNRSRSSNNMHLEGGYYASDPSVNNYSFVTISTPSSMATPLDSNSMNINSSHTEDEIEIHRENYGCCPSDGSSNSDSYTYLDLSTPSSSSTPPSDSNSM